MNAYHKGGVLAHIGNMTVIRNCYFDQAVAPDEGFGLPVDKEYMKTAAFVNQLNNGSTVFMMDHEPFVNDGYPIFGTDGLIFVGAEWFYEILNDDGSITYQHLQCTGDTTINEKRPKVIVRSNTHYDRSEITEVTHEYVYEENGEVYWWNKELQAFTLLYDFSAEESDEWEIKVGLETIVIRVYEMETYMIDGIPYKRMTIGDVGNLFSGTLISTIGHLTSFFPEKLMTRGKGYRVEGMRCYWLNGDLMLKLGEKDCDEIYNQYHFGLDETDDAAFAVYPNPATGVLFVETSLPEQTYRITNLMGQTLLQGKITTETQQIDISNLSTGMYFFSVGEQTVKFVKQ
ncbi:MAG: T9SS type A sorting domain-containing protein [Bacteroidales bacterium]|nr:T9SS type A sorting domain-containing protein [Bacteroidales bacterium]